MKKVLTLTLLFVPFIFIALSCKSAGEQEEFYFSNFDEVEHYFIKIDEHEIYPLLDNLENEKNRALIDYILEDYPEDIEDSSIIKNLNIAGYTSQPVDKSKHEALNNLFKKKKHEEVYALACIAEYRDILLFYSEQKLVGLAKICFSCDQHWIIGTEVNTANFGMSGDYRKLYELLYK